MKCTQDLEKCVGTFEGVPNLICVLNVKMWMMLTPCRRATHKCVITVPCVVDGSRISAFFTRRLAHAFATCSGSLIASRLSPA